MSQRQLAAIMFTDIQGYTSIMQHDEQYGIKVRERHRSIFEKMMRKYNGKLLQYFGDGTLSVFPSAVDAVECAVELQQNFKKDPPIPLRIGIHTGDITFDEVEAYGHGMNVAARIEPICVPGGIFVSGRVYDDIQNHEWLRAKSLGHYQLKNIRDEIEIFAISNAGLNQPEFDYTDEPLPIEARPVSPDPPPRGSKSKITAGFLALFLGLFGVHRLYLGDKKSRGIGIALLSISLVGMFTGVDFMVAVPAIIGFVEAILFFTMPKVEFDRKHNGIETPEKQKPQKRRRERPRRQPNLLEVAYAKMKKRNYESAIVDLETLLENKPEDPTIHFSLAMCFSMIEDAKAGFDHLSLAVQYGFNDFKRIDNHFSLAFLRSRKEFETFKANGYQTISLLPQPQEDFLQKERPLLLKKLEEIERLGELRDNGQLSEKEFIEQKRRLFEN